MLTKIYNTVFKWNYISFYVKFPPISELLKSAFNTVSNQCPNVLSVSLDRFHNCDNPVVVDDSMFGPGSWTLIASDNKLQDLCDPVSVRIHG